MKSAMSANEHNKYILDIKKVYLLSGIDLFPIRVLVLINYFSLTTT